MPCSAVLTPWIAVAVAAVSVALAVVVVVTLLCYALDSPAVRHSKTLVASLLAVAMASVATAQNDTIPNARAVMPERPTVATHAFTVAPGYVEIETGLERDHFAPSADGLGFPTVVKIGLAQRAQLGLNLPLMKAPGSSTGIGDVGVGLKYRFVDDAPLVGAVALLPSIKAPTGDDNMGRGTGTTDFSIIAISSHKFGDYAVDINAGYTRRTGNGPAPSNATVWTASFGGPLAGAFGWVWEFFGYPGTGGPSGQAPTVAILAGPTLLAMETLALDAGVIVPLHGPQPHALYAGLVYNVGRIFSVR
jgi:hypothetical protein